MASIRISPAVIFETLRREAALIKLDQFKASGLQSKDLFLQLGDGFLLVLDFAQLGRSSPRLELCEAYAATLINLSQLVSFQLFVRVYVELLVELLDLFFHGQTVLAFQRLVSSCELNYFWIC